MMTRDMMITKKSKVLKLLKIVQKRLNMISKGIPGHLQRTSGKWGGGGFEILDIPGRGEGVVCESSDVRKFLKKSKFLRAL